MNKGKEIPLEIIVSISSRNLKKEERFRQLNIMEHINCYQDSYNSSFIQIMKDLFEAQIY